MKKFLFSVLVACAFAVLSSQLVFAQWDYGRSIRDNMAMEHAHRISREARLEANRKPNHRATKRAATQKSTTARRIHPSATKPALQPLPHYGLQIRRDSYQDFHRESDTNGFRTNFTFTSVATGKSISKWGYCRLYDLDSEIEGIPAGTYLVRAEVPFGGKIYPAHIGSREGSTENRKGGDFAPSFKVVFKPIVDEYGSRVMDITPKKIYVRVLE